jgi:Ti-type conjugative transfer relaxase TraA
MRYRMIMANYHLTVKMISRTGGKSCVSSLAYRSATQLKDLKTGEAFDYTEKGFVGHVDILLPEDAPEWISELAEECKTNKQSALQKLSNIFEAAEKRKDAQVYREVEFSLPNELSDEQNIKWAKEFIQEVCIKKGMVAITSFHFDIDKITGLNKPHCHVLLSTRDLCEEGLNRLKSLEWNQDSLVHELRQQCEQYQNLALKEHGFESRVDHRSYAERGLDIDPQPKLNSAIIDMNRRGIKTDKQSNFDVARLKNQFKILRDPELVLSIVTSNHSTFTRHDIARVLNRYIDDPTQFRNLHDRLLGSHKLVRLDKTEGEEPVFTTKEMLRVEMGLVNTAERISAQLTHEVGDSLVKLVIDRQNEKLAQYGGLSTDQSEAIRHMLKGSQISCVVGYAGAGKTTSLEAAREAWESSGYKVVGLAPTGKAARNIEDSGIRSLTIHKFLLAQGQGREQISSQTVIVLDEAGMVDSRRFGELLSIVERAGAKIVAMGDGNQIQAIEAGPAFRLLTNRVEPAVLETIVRQQEDWQKEATKLFGSAQADKALSLYMEKGAIKFIEERESREVAKDALTEYCLARQMSGRVWKEMISDYEQEQGKTQFEQIDFNKLSDHQDYGLYERWKQTRYKAVSQIIIDFEGYQEQLRSRGVDLTFMESLVSGYRSLNAEEAAIKGTTLLQQVDETLRKMSYSHLVDTRCAAKDELVQAWARDRETMPEHTHIMLAFTNKDTVSLNEQARKLMKGAGVIKGRDFTFATHSRDQDDFGKEIINKKNKSFAEGDRLLFTQNNNSLGVKNGTLGTVISLDKSKMIVAIDGKDNRELSFAPNLYPYIDHGWATNIIKSQGITVDHVKKLASFEEYRNLAYVGMSRHRLSLEIFGSTLDFWRPEKVIDRLSRVQEKLSGYDYLDSQKIEELMKQDSEVIWHRQILQQGGDLWSAIKGTARSAFDQLLDRPQEGVSIDPLKAMENSEERRSMGFFPEKEEHGPGTVNSPTLASKELVDAVEPSERYLAWNAIKESATKLIENRKGINTLEKEPIGEKVADLTMAYAQNNNEPPKEEMKQAFIERAIFEEKNRVTYENAAQGTLFEKVYSRIPKPRDQPLIEMLSEQAVAYAGYLFQEHHLKEGKAPAPEQIAKLVNRTLSDRLHSEYNLAKEIQRDYHLNPVEAKIAAQILSSQKDNNDQNPNIASEQSAIEIARFYCHQQKLSAETEHKQDTKRPKALAEYKQRHEIAMIQEHYLKNGVLPAQTDYDSICNKVKEKIDGVGNKIRQEQSLQIQQQRQSNQTRGIDI